MPTPNEAWIEALEAGKVLFFPKLGFEFKPEERAFLDPKLLAEGVRNISLDGNGKLKGVVGDEAVQKAVAEMIGRFRTQARGLIDGLLPAYGPHLRMAPTSFRPAQVETRVQSWRADDRRLHVDSFPSRPNYGERILRVFTNVNPGRLRRASGAWASPSRTWPSASCRAPSPIRAGRPRRCKALHVTKSLRSEYDHLMLQLHDGMKSDLDYQRERAAGDGGLSPGFGVGVLFRPDLARRHVRAIHDGADPAPAGCQPIQSVRQARWPS